MIGLADRSHKPQGRQHQMSAQTQVRVIELLGQSLFWGPIRIQHQLLCEGIDHLLTAPRSPTTTGKIERFHRSLRTEFLTSRTFETKEHAQSELDTWVNHYNTERPHQGIGMITPITRFASPGVNSIGPELDATAARDQRTGPDWISRRVGANGVVSIAWQQISVGKHRGGHNVDGNGNKMSYK